MRRLLAAASFSLAEIVRGTSAVYDKQALMQLVRDKALRFGQFTLASGKQASYYLDGKQVTLDSAGARLIAAGILERLGQPLPQGRRRDGDRRRSDHRRRDHPGRRRRTCR